MWELGYESEMIAEWMKSLRSNADVTSKWDWEMMLGMVETGPPFTPTSQP